MSIPSVMQCLKNLDKNPKNFASAFNFLKKAIATDDELSLEALSECVAEADDTETQLNFDLLMDVLTVEPLDNADSRSWRTFSLGIVLKHKGSLVVTHCKDYSVMEKSLQVFLGLKNAPLKVSPLIMPTSLAFKYSVFDKLKFSSHVKKELTTAESSFNPPKSPNLILNEDPDMDLAEGILFFNVFCTASEGTHILTKLEDIATSSIKNQFLTAADNLGQSHPVDVLIADGGTPWRVMNESLHTVNVLKISSLVGHFLDTQIISNKCSIAVTCLTSETPDEFSIKLSFLSPDNELIAGCVEHGVLDTTLFYEKLESCLSTMGLNSPYKVLELFPHHLIADNQFYVPQLRKWEALGDQVPG